MTFLDFFPGEPAHTCILKPKNLFAVEGCGGDSHFLRDVCHKLYSQTTCYYLILAMMRLSTTEIRSGVREEFYTYRFEFSYQAQGTRLL